MSCSSSGSGCKAALEELRGRDWAARQAIFMKCDEHEVANFEQLKFGTSPKLEPKQSKTRQYKPSGTIEHG